MKLLIDIDENCEKDRLTLGFLKELGFDVKKMPTATDYAFPANRKISTEVLNFVLDKAEISEGLFLNEEIAKYIADKK